MVINTSSATRHSRKRPLSMVSLPTRKKLLTNYPKDLLTLLDDLAGGPVVSRNFILK